MDTSPDQLSFDLPDQQEFAAALQLSLQSLTDPDGRLAIDPDHVEQDLTKLVLVVVELLRRLMEHQAMARMDRGTLSEAQIDQLGTALFRAEARIEELREAFGIPIEDFNVALGPLGRLL